MRIAVDFDGTIVEHCFPEIGPAVPGALEWMKVFQELGAEIYLWTVRGWEYVEQAEKYCRDNGIRLKGVNQVPGCQYGPGSPKIHADIFIDDRAYGCPLVTRLGAPPYVDWSKVGPDVTSRIAHQRKFSGKG